jgi:cyclic pyranopterin phosphate synthase
LVDDLAAGTRNVDAAPLPCDASDADIASAIGLIWNQRDDRYSELRGQNLQPPQVPGQKRVEMSYIGG